jgi:diadenosine tetraphosphate (Ap4A) HIT family hydrolase
MEHFQLDKTLEQDCYFVTELSFSRLLLMNDQQYPWLILVPRVESAQELYELTFEQQQALWTEIADTSKLLKQLFSPIKLNIGALGNIVRQLHVHIIARFEQDNAWPGPVWGAHKPVTYSDTDANALIEKIKQALN